MTARDAKSRPVRANRSFRPRRLELADGGALLLDGDGSIRRVDGAGATTARWSPGEPDWDRHAIRFGLTTHARTVAPHGPGDPAPRSVAG